VVQVRKGKGGKSISFCFLEGRKGEEKKGLRAGAVLPDAERGNRKEKGGEGKRLDVASRVKGGEKYALGSFCVLSEGGTVKLKKRGRESVSLSPEKEGGGRGRGLPLALWRGDQRSQEGGRGTSCFLFLAMGGGGGGKKAPDVFL